MKIPNKADARLSIRLMNQRMLMSMSEDVGSKSNSEDVAGRLNGSESCWDICKRICFVDCVKSSWRLWYDSTMNAVRTAEKRPA
jgi:hypothetical protein